ncbi:TPA: Asp-tRNA(Asn)/Glu-tRNA(Gln) amidotransferase subunit GatB [Candidatus Saccharibacteria bacterium]|nr:Asp-tRNA(Asn)/Glu-tRNA(Gln) amidotransferase subunit GatB [Candidatus Saccharibacteria bacterium]HIO87446.1 Asp-tRNA(Asn)/Glu-tRNA(Gln) amidotransferase subunit GatB [Candidatus Saccharibacteria bacterium]
MIITDDIRKKYVPTIGIECHVQLKTKTKLFAPVSNEAREAEPNTLVSPLCFGLPGTLPVLNEFAVELAIKAGLAMNGEIASFMKFDRKQYFYPDLPKGYQITQFDKPIITSGWLDVPQLDGSQKRVEIERAHMEEDAGKSTHPEGSDFSLVDLNRAGTPLLEIVSKPDMHSAAEARAYAHELFLAMKYADVSEADLYHGNMRFDVNVSIAPVGSTELGTRSETKNLNSFKSIERATLYEIDRQIELLEKGKQVVQETRGWNDAKQITTSQRSKENAHDYRYFPEPDLPPVEITGDQVQAVKKTLPQLPVDIRTKLQKLGIDSQQIAILLEEKRFVDIVLAVDKKHIKKAVNWITSDVQAVVNDGEFDWATFTLTSDDLNQLAIMVADGKLSSTGAKEVLLELITSTTPAEAIATDKKLIQESDEGAIEAIVDSVIAANSSAAEDVKNGEMKAIGFLVGQVMKQSKGKANPQIVNKLLKEKLQS